MQNRVCKYCNLEFNISGKVFSCHVRWCNKNPQRNATENITKAVNKALDKKLGPLVQFNVFCSKCGKKFVVEEREYKFPTKAIYFCSRSCANSRVKSEASKLKTSLTFKTKGISFKSQKICPQCNNTVSHRRRKFCDSNCLKLYRKSPNEYASYKNECKFKFNLADYPQEFDFELINKYGWYSAANAGNNLTGISRDHCISIKYGWENNISPILIAHPANCQLMLHNENVSKHKKCSISLIELENKIKEWDKKYN